MSDEKTELVRTVEERVDGMLHTIRLYIGKDTAETVERTARRVVSIVEETERELATRWITLQEAVDRSGYSYDSIQRYAKSIIDGEHVPEPWASMEVRKLDGQPYEVRAGSVPVKLGKAS